MKKSKWWLPGKHITIMPKEGRTTQNGMGSEEVRSFDNLLTDHRPYDFIPQGVWPFSRSLFLYVLAVVPGEV
jgi:hypothetical protein